MKFKSLISILTLLFVLTSIKLTAIDLTENDETSIKTALDSAIVYDMNENIKFKQHYIFNERGYIYQISHLLPDEKYGGFRGETKQLYEYNYRDDVKVFTVQEWNLNNYTWRNESKGYYKYNQKGDHAGRENYVWSKVSKEWVRQDKEDIEFDEDFRMIKSKHYRLKNNDWELNRIYEYEYKNSITKEIYKEHVADTIWDVKLIKNKRYSETDKLLTDTTYISLIKEFDVININNYSYDDSGNLIEKTSYKYDDKKDKATNDSKHIYEYDANNNRTLDHYMKWNTNAEKWDNMTKKEWVFDDNSNLLEEISYEIYDEENQEWIPSYKLEYEVDTEIAADDLLLPPSMKYDFNNKVNTQAGYSWDRDSGSWELNERSEYYYSEKLTSVEDKGSLDIQVYPNPAEDMLNISGINTEANFNIYNLAGEKIISTKILPGDTVSITELSTGAYIWKVNINGVEYTGKVIKR